MPDVLDWQRTADRSEIVQRAARELGAGNLVAFPTETVYGIAASAQNQAAVDRLVATKGRDKDKPLTMALAWPEQVEEWLPDLGIAGRRLARRSWPGPLTLVSAEGVCRGQLATLAEPVRQRICPKGALGLRVPAHEAILQVMDAGAGPIVLSSANVSGQPEATTAEEVIQAMGNELALVVADVQCQYKKPSTVVRVEGSSFEVLREGVLSKALVERLTASIIVFVCTGNTCRSPIAEALFKDMLARRLGCRIDDLAQKGFVVLSAGTAAMIGGKAAPEAVAAGGELGGDLSQHISRPLSPQLAAEADVLVAMARGHLLTLAEQFPEGPPPRLLGADGQDIPDPIGCDQQVYRDCARQIQDNLERLLPEVLKR
jgi:protein-tyrosine phosphatase